MSQRRILFVDGEPDTRFLSRAILEQAGYGVDVAGNAFAQVQLRPPDLLIADPRMPNIDGFELLSVIRTRFPESPLIAISGEGSVRIVLYDFSAGHRSPHAGPACCSVEGCRP